MTPAQAQAIHESRMQADPGHDRCDCWCCCVHCDFDLEDITVSFGLAGTREL